MKRLEYKIIDFISGEMDEFEKAAFEEQIAVDSALRKKVVEMQSTQSALSSWDDETIDIPEMEFPAQQAPVSATKVVQFKTGTSWIKYAAAAAALIGMFWISGLQVHKSGNALTLSFGAPSVQENLEERIDIAVNNALEKYTTAQNAQLARIENNIDTELKSVQTSINQVSDNWKKEKRAVQVMMDNLSTTQFARLEDIIQSYQIDQGAHIDQSFADLMEYIDDKRIDDLFQIQDAFTEIVAAIDEQHERTDELLQGLVQPVATNY